jgi:hypothetical protein
MKINAAGTAFHAGYVVFLFSQIRCGKKSGKGVYWRFFCG